MGSTNNIDESKFSQFAVTAWTGLLISAIDSNDEDAIKELIQRIPTNADIRSVILKTVSTSKSNITDILLATLPENTRNSWNLRLASREGNQAEVDVWLRNPMLLDLPLTLEFAAEDGDADITQRIFLDTKVDFDCTQATVQAILTGHQNVLSILAKEVPDRINFNLVTQFAESRGDSLSANTLRENFNLALEEAAQDEDAEAIAKLLQNAPTNFDPRPALVEAITAGENDEIVEALQNHAPQSLKNAYDFYQAVKAGDQPTIDTFLLAKNFDQSMALALILNSSPNDQKWTNILFNENWNTSERSLLLRIAARAEIESLVDQLTSSSSSLLDCKEALKSAEEIQHVPIINKLSAYLGNTLKSAAQQGDKATVQQLIDVGSPYLESTHYRSAFLHALAFDRVDTADILAIAAGKEVIESWRLRIAALNKNWEEVNEILSKASFDPTAALGLFSGDHDSDGTMVYGLTTKFHQSIDYNLVLEIVAIFNNTKLELTLASLSGNKQVIEKLIATDVTSLDLRQAIINAESNGHFEVASILLQAFTKAVDAAIQNHSIDTLAKLLENPPVNYKFLDPIWAAAIKGQDDIAEVIANSPYSSLKGSWSLWTAVKNRDIEKIQTLLHDPTIYPTFSLDLAAIRNDEASIELLLKSISPTLNFRYAIEHAFKGGHTAIAERLIQHCTKAIEDATENGDTILVDKMLDFLPNQVNLAAAIIKAGNNGHKKIELDLRLFAKNRFEFEASSGNVDNVTQALQQIEVSDKRWAIAGAVIGHFMQVAELVAQGTSKEIQKSLSAFTAENNSEEIDRLLNDSDFDWSLALSLTTKNTTLAQRILDKMPYGTDLSVPLAAAAFAKNYELVTKLLAKSPEVDRSLALISVMPDIKNGHQPIAIVDELLNGAPPSLQNRHLIQHARALSMDWLAERLTTHFSQALAIAATNRQCGTVAQLLKNAPYNVDTSDALANAAWNDHDDVVSQFLKEPSLTLNRMPALVSAAMQDNVDVLTELLKDVPPTFDCSEALTSAATNGKKASVILLLNTGKISDFNSAAIAAAKGGRKKIVEQLLRHASDKINAFSVIEAAILSKNEDIAELIVQYSSDSIKKAWSLRQIAKDNGPEAAQTYLLNNPDLDRSTALALASLENREELIDQLLKGPQDGLDRENAITAAAGISDAPTIEKLLRGSPITLNLDLAIVRAEQNLLPVINNADFANNRLIQARNNNASEAEIKWLENNLDTLAKQKNILWQLKTSLERQRNINFLIQSRPSVPSDFATLSDEKKEAIHVERRAWLRNVMGVLPRVDEEVMPALADAVQPWLPSNTSSKMRALLTQKFRKLDERYGKEIAPFTAFISLAELTKDFDRHKEAYQKRVWNLLKVMIAKNHKMLRGKPGKPNIDDKEHKELQERLNANALDALGECVDRLANGLRRLEKIVMYVPAKHFDTAEEHVDFMRKMLVDDGKSDFAEIKAAEIWLDGYQFPPGHIFQPNDARAMTGHNWGEQVEIKSLLDVHMGPEYQFDNAEAVMQFETTVQDWARRAKPDKYGHLNNEMIADSIAKEIKEIIDDFISGNPQPERLIKMIDSANDTRRKDGRKVDPTPSDPFPIDRIEFDPDKHMTLENYGVHKYDPWAEFAKRKYKELFDREKAKKTEIQALEKLEKERAKIENKFAPPKWINGRIKDRSDKAFAIEYQKWAVKPENDKEDDHLYELNAKIFEIEKNVSSEQRLSKNLLQQFLAAEPLLGENRKWEPFGLNSRMGMGADYTVIGIKNDKVFLQRELMAPPRSVIAMDVSHLPAGIHLQELENAMKEKKRIFVKCKDGKIEAFEIRGVKRKNNLDHDTSRPKRRSPRLNP